MKTKIILALLTAIATNLNAQWTGAPGNIYYNSGNVGIGVDTPSEKLEIKSVNPSIRVGDSQDVSTFGNTFTEMSSIKFFHHYNTLIGAKIYTVKKYNGMSWGGTDLRFSVSNISNNSVADAMTINYLGNVGIGTTTPSAKFHIVSPGGLNSGILLESSSAAGYSSSDLMNNSGDLAQVSLSGSSFQNGMALSRQVCLSSGAVNGISLISYDVNGFIAFGTGGISTVNERMRIVPGGNVLIGKTTQVNAAHKLDVNGSIRSNEVVVNTTGADFVFEKDYRLMTLEMVEEFIKENKHLPDIEPAKEMEEKGLALGKMDMKLLQKIEELTLYMIDFKKEIEILKEEIKELKKD